MTSLAKLSKYAQLSAFLLLALISYFWSFIESTYPGLTIHKIGALVLITIVATIVYFDSRLDRILSSPEGTIKRGSLGECIDAYIKDNTHLKELRVYATSSEAIQPLIGARNIHIKKCKILINLNMKDGKIDRSDRYNIRTLHLVDEWNQLQKDGRIDTLEIRNIASIPLSYEVIFDQKAILLGKYFVRKNVPAGVEFMDPFLIRGQSSETKELIGTYIVAFDKSFDESDKFS